MFLFCHTHSLCEFLDQEAKDWIWATAVTTPGPKPCVRLGIEPKVLQSQLRSLTHSATVGTPSTRKEVCGIPCLVSLCLKPTFPDRGCSISMVRRVKERRMKSQSWLNMDTELYYYEGLKSGVAFMQHNRVYLEWHTAAQRKPMHIIRGSPSPCTTLGRAVPLWSKDCLNRRGLITKSQLLIYPEDSFVKIFKGKEDRIDLKVFLSLTFS